MTFEFIKLELLQLSRSFTLSRDIISKVIVAAFVGLLFLTLFILSFALPKILKQTLGITNVLLFINANLLFFFLFEFMYRFFVQKSPVLALEKFLHLPVPISKITHYLLAKSFLSPYNFVVVACFLPFSIVFVDTGNPTSWFLNLLILSWTLHFFILWYKQKFNARPVYIFMLLLVVVACLAAQHYGIFNAGKFVAPFFQWSLNSYIPLIISCLLFGGMYVVIYNYYRNNAYTEELSNRKESKTLIHRSLGFYSRFGLAGEIADLELKLILRHKKSRGYLILSFLFLLYGIFMYKNSPSGTEAGFNGIHVLIGTFITGIFILQYGQFFLSWNSRYFDFYLNRSEGIDALVKGKFLLFIFISSICFILTIPYAYYGWHIVLVNLAAFLFNLGISIHFVIYLALWQPQPMDLSKSSLFNYEGMGIAQFIMGIPFIVLPVVIYGLTSYLSNKFLGLAVVGLIGIIGLIFFEQLSNINIKKLKKNRHKISMTFRQDI
ncbi:MAG: hypothetical protein FH748_03835 [Balneolaceae bacterium]|nr:hypothetical protein [Balneolaceae bacterium]